MISFKIPQKIPMNLGYYYSPEKVTESSKLKSDLYIGISLGGVKASDLGNHRYIYFLQNETKQPQLVDEYMVPQEGHVYLLSSHASTFGDRDSWIADETVAPAGIIAYYTGWNSVQEMKDDNGKLAFQEQVHKGNLYPDEPTNTTSATVPSPGDTDVTISVEKVNGVWTGVGGRAIGQMSVASNKPGLNDVFGPFILDATGFEYEWEINTNTGTYVSDVKNFNDLKNKYNYIWDVTLDKNDDNTYLNNDGKLKVNDRRLKNWSATKMAGADVGRRHDIAALPFLTLSCFYKVVLGSDGKWTNNGHLFKDEDYTVTVGTEKVPVFIVPYPLESSSDPNPRFKYIWKDKAYLDIWWSYIFSKWMRADDDGVPPVEAYKEGMGWNLSYGDIYMHNNGYGLMFELVAEPGSTKWDNENNVARIESASGPFRIQYKDWIIEGNINFIGTTMKWIDDSGGTNPYVKASYFDSFNGNGTYVMYDHQTNNPRTYEVENRIFPVITVKTINAIATDVTNGKRYKYSYAYDINNPAAAATINDWTQVN